MLQHLKITKNKTCNLFTFDRKSDQCRISSSRITPASTRIVRFMASFFLRILGKTRGRYPCVFLSEITKFHAKAFGFQNKPQTERQLHDSCTYSPCFRIKSPAFVPSFPSWTTASRRQTTKTSSNIGNKREKNSSITIPTRHILDISTSTFTTIRTTGRSIRRKHMNACDEIKIQ